MLNSWRYFDISTSRDTVEGERPVPEFLLIEHSQWMGRGRPYLVDAKESHYSGLCHAACINKDNFGWQPFSHFFAELRTTVFTKIQMSMKTAIVLIMNCFAQINRIQRPVSLRIHA